MTEIKNETFRFDVPTHLLVRLMVSQDQSGGFIETWVNRYIVDCITEYGLPDRCLLVLRGHKHYYAKGTASEVASRFQ